MTHVFRVSLLGLIGLLAAACNVNTRSGEYACNSQDDCQDGRACEQGWCVIPACPLECDRCDDGVCVIECNGIRACSDRVVCPPGLDCRVECSGIESCRGVVDCSQAGNCNIRCTGTAACADDILCSRSGCTVTCNNLSTCAGVIDCDDSCECVTQCTGLSACQGGALCPRMQCEAGNGCDNSHPQCRC